MELSNRVKEKRDKISGSTKIVGVFGYPIEHSLSPAMHNAAFAELLLPYIYVPFSIKPESLESAIRCLPHLGIVGVNLTIPHKERVLPFLDYISEEAREVGAVNTIHCHDSQLFGENTDGYGFFEPLREIKLSLAGKFCVVMGAGGSARSVIFRLLREGANVTIANRTKERADRLLEFILKAGYSKNSVLTIAIDDSTAMQEAIHRSVLLVNTTKIGMFPNCTEIPPVPENSLHRNLVVYDLIYNPVETELLKIARTFGCRTINGVKMLVHQGAAAFHIWTSIRPPTVIMEAAVMAGLIHK